MLPARRAPAERGGRQGLRQHPELAAGGQQGQEAGHQRRQPGRGRAACRAGSDEVLDGEKWMDHLPEFKAWIASLSEKTLYKHLLESLNVAAESDEGTGLIEQLSESDLASAVDGFDAHLADALVDFSSEEDLENEPVL